MKILENMSERRKRNYLIKRGLSIKYLRESINKGYFPSYRELNKKFGIGHLRITSLDLYEESGVKFLDIINTKRPNNVTDKVKKDLIEYIKERVSKGYFPSRREIERKFKLTIVPMFKGIKDLYKKSGVPYKQKSNQELKNEKSKLLTKVVLSILPKLNLRKIKVRDVTERGIDILTEDLEGRQVGIELKGYSKYEMVKIRNIKQIERWLENDNFYKIILITTTSRTQKNMRLPKNLEIIDFVKLKNLIDDKELKNIEFIRNFSIHVDTKEHERKRELIKNYILSKYTDNDRINIRDLNKNLRLDIRTYFRNQLEVYKHTGIIPPLELIGRKKNRDKERLRKYYFGIWRSKIKNYLLKEVSKGHYPTGEEINKRFNLSHIWNYMKVSDLYEEIGIENYFLRRMKRGFYSCNALKRFTRDNISGCVENKLIKDLPFPLNGLTINI